MKRNRNAKSQSVNGMAAQNSQSDEPRPLLRRWLMTCVAGWAVLFVMTLLWLHIIGSQGTTELAAILLGLGWMAASGLNLFLENCPDKD